MVGSGSQAGAEAPSMVLWRPGGPCAAASHLQGEPGEALEVPNGWLFPGGPFLPSRSLPWVAQDVFWQLR